MCGTITPQPMTGSGVPHSPANPSLVVSRFLTSRKVGQMVVFPFYRWMVENPSAIFFCWVQSLRKPPHENLYKLLKILWNCWGISPISGWPSKISKAIWPCHPKMLLKLSRVPLKPIGSSQNIDNFPAKLCFAC